MPDFDPQRLRETKIAKERGGFSKEFLESKSEAGTPAFDPQELARLKKAKTTMTPVGRGPQRYPIGATIGGVAGSFSPYPIITGTAGAALGDIAQTVVESLLSASRPEGRDILKSAGKEAAYSLGGGVGGKYAMRGLQNVLAPFEKTITPGAQQAMGTLEKAGVRPGLLPAEATESPVLDYLHNIAENSFMGQGMIANYKRNRDVILDKMGEELAESIGRRSTPDQVGELFSRVVQGNLKAARAPATVLYNTVESMVKPETVIMTKTELVPTSLFAPSGRPLMRETTRQVEEEVGGVRVPLETSKEFAKPLAEQATRLHGVQATAAGDPLMEAIQAMPQALKFSDAQALRSRLISFVDQMNVENKNAPAIGKAKQLIKRLDTAMERALEAQNPEALAMWREANDIWAKGNAKFNNSLVRRLMKMSMEEFGGNPEGVVKAIMSMDASRINRVKSAVGAQLWERFKNVAAETYVRNAFNREGVIQGNALFANLLGRGGIKERQAAAIFSQPELTKLTNFANALRLVQAKQGSGTGRMWIQLAQGGAIANLAGLGPSAAKPASAAVLLGPPAIAYIMQHPTLSKWFIEGMQLPQGSELGGTLVGRLLTALPPRYVDQTEGTVKLPSRPQTRPPSAFALQP